MAAPSRATRPNASTTPAIRLYGAKRSRHQLRIDAMRNATSQLVSTAIAQTVVPNQFKIGVYTFANSVTTVAALTTNLPQVQTALSSIVLPVTNIGTQIGGSVDWLSQNVVDDGVRNRDPGLAVQICVSGH